MKRLISAKWAAGGLAVLLAVCAGALLCQFIDWSRERALGELERKSRAQLQLYTSHLQGQLEKYEFLPELLATNERLVNRLRDPGNAAEAEGETARVMIHDTGAGIALQYLEAVFDSFFTTKEEGRRVITESGV
ncbi:MAG: hypothetical protein AB2814_06500 [Candidatus Sedimenticola endophacoides]